MRDTNILFNNEQLLQLIRNLYTLTGIRASIFNVNGKDINLTPDYLPFCERMNACPEGHRRCEECDARAIQDCAKKGGPYFYRCHAGILEAAIPIKGGGTTLAYLVFGQLLDESPLEEQWENTRKTLDWFKGNLEELKQDYSAFQQYTQKEIVAYAEILEALASYIQLKGMIRTTEYTDLQRLEIFLDQHYTEKLSLTTVAQQLGIGRTKLCALAKKLSGGESLSYMITQRRVEAAKIMLMQSDAPISTVAEAVGVSDYNYFSKVFRATTGMTPRAFRSQNRHNAEKVGV